MVESRSSVVPKDVVGDQRRVLTGSHRRCWSKDDVGLWPPGNEVEGAVNRVVVQRAKSLKGIWRASAAITDDVASASVQNGSVPLMTNFADCFRSRCLFFAGQQEQKRQQSAATIAATKTTMTTIQIPMTAGM